MALAKLMASRLLQQNVGVGSQRQAGKLLAPSSYRLLSRFSSHGSAKEVAVESTDSKKRRLRSWLPRRFQRRRSEPRDIVPSFNDIFQAGLGNALLEATQNINRLSENLTPSGLIGQMKEKDDVYKLRYEVPGLAKEDLKITICDGILKLCGSTRKRRETSLTTSSGLQRAMDSITQASYSLTMPSMMISRPSSRMESLPLLYQMMRRKQSKSRRFRSTKVDSVMFLESCCCYCVEIKSCCDQI